MKVKAAVAYEAGKPLSHRNRGSGRPESRRSVGGIKATGICHTDYYTLSGADPEGMFPAILGHEGAGIVVDVGAGREQPEKGRPRDSAVHAGMPAMRILP